MLWRLPGLYTRISAAAEPLRWAATQPLKWAFTKPDSDVVNKTKFARWPFSRSHSGRQQPSSAALKAGIAPPPPPRLSHAAHGRGCVIRATNCVGDPRELAPPISIGVVTVIHAYCIHDDVHRSLPKEPSHQGAQRHLQLRRQHSRRRALHCGLRPRLCRRAGTHGQVHRAGPLDHAPWRLQAK